MISKNDENLRILSRAIALSGNHFSLVIVRCNYCGLGRKMIDRVKELGVYELVLGSNSVNLVSLIGELVLGFDSVKGVIVSGWELVSKLEVFIQGINQGRDEFRKLFGFPIIFWVTDRVLESLIRIAPDFKSWSATPIEFDLDSDELLELMEQTSDRVFELVLNAGAGRFLNSKLLELGDDSPTRFELETAREELIERGVNLSVRLEASWEFVLAQLCNGSRELAMAHYERSLNLWNQIDDLVRKGCTLFYIGRWWRTLGLQYPHELERGYKMAKGFLEKAIGCFDKVNRVDLVSKFINGLGELLYKLGEWEELERVVFRSLDLHLYYDFDQGRLAHDYALLAAIHLSKHSVTEAVEYGIKSVGLLDEVEKRNDDGGDRSLDWIRQYSRSSYLLILARCYILGGEFKRAIAELEKARFHHHHSHDPFLHLEILQELRKLYEKDRNYLKAFSIKQECRSVEQQYGLRAFIGAGRLLPKQQIFNPSDPGISSQGFVAEEIIASGRNKDVKNLLDRMGRDDYKLTIIYGQSGVGKSSILEAGLIPSLRRKAIKTRDVLPILIQVYQPSWIELLGMGLGVGIDSVELILKKLFLNGSGCLMTVLIFDQFEDFFSGYKSLDQRMVFYNFLADCLEIPFVKVIISLREDHIPFLLECGRMVSLEVINQNILDKQILYYLGNFSIGNAKSVIKRLTQRTKLYLEPMLVEQLVKDLAGPGGEVRPIELQIVGAQLQAERITRLEQYYKSGPVEKLVERYLTEAIKDCGIENTGIAYIILHLLTDESGTRPLKTKSDLALELENYGLGAISLRLELVLEILVGSGIVSVVREMMGDRYQLVHDYLVPFIRQQQDPLLIEELVAAKVNQQLTEEELGRTQLQLSQLHRQIEQLLREIQLERQRASEERLKAAQERQLMEIKEIETLISLSKTLWVAPDQLGGLAAGVRALDCLRFTSVPALVQGQTISHVWEMLDQIQECRRFLGHSDWVNTVEFSPDGRLLASSSCDHSIKLWSIKGGLLKTFVGHDHWVWGVCFSPDGSLLASASFDRTVKIWSVMEGSLLETLSGHLDWVNTVCFSPDGSWLASGGFDGTVRLWSLIDDQVICLEHDSWVTSICFSPDGGLLASTSRDRTVKLWGLDGSLVRTLEGFQSSVHVLGFSFDGELIATGLADGYVKIWTRSGQLFKSFMADPSGVNSLCFGGEGNMLVTGGSVIKLWNVMGKELQGLNVHHDRIWCVRFSPDGRFLVSAGSDHTIRLSMVNRLGVKVLRRHDYGILSVLFNPVHDLIASGDEGGIIKIWRWDSGEVRLIEGHEGGVNSLCFSSDGKVLVSGGDDGIIRLWDLWGNLLFQIVSGGSVGSVVIGDGNRIMVSGRDGVLSCWSDSVNLIWSFLAHDQRINQVAINEGGSMMATGSCDGTIKLWSQDGELVQTLVGDEQGVLGVSFSPDGRLIASGSYDGTVRLWGVDGELLKVMRGHQGSVGAIAFSRCGGFVISGGGDRTIRVWNLDGELIHHVMNNSHQIQSLSISSDGRYLVFGTLDGCCVVRRFYSPNQLLAESRDWLGDFLL